MSDSLRGGAQPPVALVADDSDAHGPLWDWAGLQGTSGRPIDAHSRQGPSGVRASPARRHADAGAATVAGQLWGVRRKEAVGGRPSGWP